MRGQQSLLFVDFSQPDTTETESLDTRKGRSPLLLKSRNQKIIARYYYHNAIRNQNRSIAVELLMVEFDLDDRTIATILQKEADAIFELRKKKPTLRSLRNKYSYMRW